MFFGDAPEVGGLPVHGAFRGIKQTEMYPGRGGGGGGVGLRGAQESARLEAIGLTQRGGFTVHPARHAPAESPGRRGGIAERGRREVYVGLQIVEAEIEAIAACI